MQLTDKELITALEAALSIFREEIDPDITAARILTLLATTQHPGCPQAEMERYVKGMSTSGISRNILDWSEVNNKREPGPNFILAKPDPTFRKRHLLYPTDRAWAFLSRVTAAVNKRLG